jgi:hypothetical protein
MWGSPLYLIGWSGHAALLLATNQELPVIGFMERRSGADVPFAS